MKMLDKIKPNTDTITIKIFGERENFPKFIEHLKEKYKIIHKSTLMFNEERNFYFLFIKMEKEKEGKEAVECFPS